jgi:hypothetical protein
MVLFFVSLTSTLHLNKAERKIHTINNMICTLLAHSSVPPSFWHHVLQMTTYLLNILPRKNLTNHSPTQLLYHRDPFYTHLRIFCCFCYLMFPSNIINKFQPCLLRVTDMLASTRVYRRNKKSIESTWTNEYRGII